MPWAIFSWSVLALSVFFPFLVFLSRRAKQVPKAMATVAVAICCGMWLERYVLIVPSLWHRDALPLGWIELGVTAGFFGACGLSCLFFLARFPVIPFVAQAARPAELEIERADEHPSKA